MDFYINVGELQKIYLLVDKNLFKDNTHFFNKAVNYGKDICEKELYQYEKIRKEHEFAIGK